MSHSDDLKKIWTEAVRIAGLDKDLADERKALRQVATDKGFDWSQIKSLAGAHVKDAEDGGTRVEKLITKADFACAYAGLLGLDERKRETRSSSPTRASVSGAEAEVRSPPSASPNSVSFEAAASETAARSPLLSKGEGRIAIDSTLRSAPLVAAVGMGGRETATTTEFPESEPVTVRGSDLGRLDAAGNTALLTGSPPISSDPLSIPSMLRREPNDPVWS